MRPILRLIYLSLLILSLCTITYATNYYVDNTVSSSGNGLSWGTAWKNFSDINWGSIEPGDIIYISGGTDSTVYYAQFDIGNVQGTVANPITIKNSYDAVHNGRVIIDGGAGARHNFYIGGSNGYSTDNITISGLELRGGHYGFYIHYKASNLVFDLLFVIDCY